MTPEMRAMRHHVRAEIAVAYTHEKSFDSMVDAALDAIPDGWAKVDGEWVRITADGVGYGEFDREGTA